MLQGACMLERFVRAQVRKGKVLLGVELGLPREMVYRHPFTGPGLGVRVLGEGCQRVSSSSLIGTHATIDTYSAQ